MSLTRTESTAHALKDDAQRDGGDGDAEGPVAKHAARSARGARDIPQPVGRQGEFPIGNRIGGIILAFKPQRPLKPPPIEASTGMPIPRRNGLSR